MIKRWLSKWLMPDATSALRLLQARFGMDVGISWSPSSNVSVAHNINVGTTAAPLDLQRHRNMDAIFIR
jgi:hypothetical protein